MSALGDDEVLEIYLDALAHVYDPHSDYLDKESMESFSISMNLSLFGIGAALGTEDGLCTIRELVPGGPAALSGALKPGDHIVAVAQDGSAAGRRHQHAAHPHRRADSRAQGLDRDADHLASRRRPEDRPPHARRGEAGRPAGEGADRRPAARRAPRRCASASSTCRLSTPATATATIGARTAPPPTSRACSTKLQAEKVRGVVLDLRRNGGGSLQEAIDLTSLFIGGGPVVQTRDAKSDIEVEADKDAKVRYTGPLVVLTSRFSASASEIVAGALQDYGRAVVVGDPSTFGKGTVQTIVPLGRGHGPGRPRPRFRSRAR